MAGKKRWLNANHFEEYGAWMRLEEKLQRVLKIKRGVPGVYAFVVKGRIVYIGKAKHLRGRIRNNERFRRTDESRPHRGAHTGLLTTLSEPGATVQVYIYRASSPAKARECEKQWIKEIDPVWNRADRLLTQPSINLDFATWVQSGSKRAICSR